MKSLQWIIALFFVLLFGVPGSAALEDEFRNPPHSAGVRCFWWWLNSNVTEEAITRDLEEMKDKGFNGALIFDADGSKQGGNRPVPAGPLFASPEWTKLFVHACREAQRLDLELSLNIQSGWNLGGPNVTEEKATQQLVWSETEVEGSTACKQVLLKHPVKAGRFYRDVAVLAVPMPEQAKAGAQVDYELQASSSWSGFPVQRAMDGDPETFWVSASGPDAGNPQWLILSLSKPAMLSALSLQGRRGYGPRAGKIQLSLDNQTFRTVKEISLKDGERFKVSFTPQQVKYIRLVFTSAYDTNPVGAKARNVQVAEIGLPGVVMPRVSTFRPIKDLKLKSATKELGGSAPDCRFLLETDPARPGELSVKCGDILNLSAKMDPDGTLRWDVPRGRWVILRFGHTPTGAHVSTYSGQWTGRVIDHLSPAALQDYWHRNVDPLIGAIGPMAGTTLRYLHTDSWEGGGMNWTSGFDRAFQTRRGYDPLPWLAVLSGMVIDDREASNAFLADFRKTIGELVAGHYEEFARLAGTHGMGIHPESAGPHAGPMDGLMNYSHSEIVMSEFWSPSPHRPAPEHRFFVKQASSAAHTYGKRLVGAEAYTTIGPHWNDSPWAHMKPTLDHELCAGLNLVFHCLFACSPQEMGLPGQEMFAGTHFNPNITWWDEAQAYIDYERRCQYLMQQGRFVADVVYYYGDHVPNIARRKGDDPAGALPGYDYDVLSEELLLSSMTVKDGRVTLPSGMAYRVLVLPDHKVLSLGVLKKLDKLVRAGATVLGPKPLKAVSLEGGAQGKELFKTLADDLWGQTRSDQGMRKVGQGRVAWGMKARELLEADGLAHDVGFKNKAMASAINWIHLRIGETDVYFLSEPNGRARNVNAIFRVNGRVPELWDAVDGSVRQANTFKLAGGCTQVPLEFGPYDSIFVVFRKKTNTGCQDGPNFPKWRTTQLITGPWDVSFDSKWGGPKDPVRFDTLTDWIDHSDDGIKYYSGKAVYRTTFDMASDLAEQALALEFGEVKDIGIAMVKLNGIGLGVVWRPPFRVDISKAVKRGKNKLEVTVVNSWRNRLIGDSKLPEDQRLTWTNIKVLVRTLSSRQTKWELEESGLLGPVRIMRTGNEK